MSKEPLNEKKIYTPFVSLHNHTELGSPLDGMNNVHQLFEQAKRLRHRAIAITDHGTLTAHYDAWKASKKTGVKLIPGCEFYFAPDLTQKKSYHLVLLPKNHSGYKNILRLNYEAYKNQVSGYMGKKTPRISWEHLEEFNKDVICLTACSNGPIAKALIADGDMEEAESRLLRLKSIFKENMFLELQPHNLKTDDGKVDQVKLNNSLVDYAEKHGLKYVVTSDAHYLDKDHAKYHDMMLAIKDKKAVDDPKRFRYGVQDMYLKDYKEILEFFGKKIGVTALKNSVIIANMCEEPTYLEPKGPRLPRFPIENEVDYSQFLKWYEKSGGGVSEDKAYLRFQCMKSFKKRFGNLPSSEKKERWDRVKYELSILEARDFSSYMLIVADYINWAKKQGIPVGPGRGCVERDVPVYTSNGVKKIQDVSIGDKVFTHTGSLKEVKNTMVYDVNETMLNIKTFYGDAKGISMTKDHKVFGQKAIISEKYAKASDKSKKAYKKWKPPTDVVSEIKAEDLSVGDYIFYPYMEWKSEKVSFSLSSIDGFKKTKSKAKINLNEDIAWFLGKWVADGWISKVKYKWGICFNVSEKEQIERAKKCLKYIGIEKYGLYEKKYANCVYIESSNKLLYNWLKSLFPNYKQKSSTKHVPEIIFSLSRKLVLSFIEGCVDGDGHRSRSRIVYRTISRTLAEEIKMLINMVGLPASIQKQHPKAYKDRPASQTSYSVVWPNLSKRSVNYKRINGGFLVKISTILEVKDIEHVYDITVEEDHSYMTTYGAIHNSAGGSLVSYLISITSVNPLEYGLIFERFHNKEKKSFPDIDTDFAHPSRVKEYLKEKYGAERVASISNWSTLSPKVVIKDVARSLNLGGDKSTAFKISNHITSIMPDAKTIEEAMSMSKEFASFMEKYPKLYEYASKLQGLTRNWGVHAAGVVISDEPLYNFVPLRIDDTGQTITQWEKNRCEENGLIKMDILGLNTLNVISDVFDIIEKTKGRKISIEDIPLDDEKTFKMISSGKNAGVFQLESSLSPLCQKIKPNDVRMISDINALGRPSCSPEDRTNYIKRRFNIQKPEFRHETLKNALGDTFGVSLYEESMMTIAKDCAGWDLNQADALRKITKLKGKDPGLVLKTQNNFIKDCMSFKKIPYAKAKEIWDLEISPYGNYGFNKSHSILYSHISVYTAWLKCHFPTEFMCGLLRAEDPNSDKAQSYINESKGMKIDIHSPNINKSSYNYIVLSQKNILTGLSAIKGLGKKAVDEVMNNQPFINLADFLTKCSGRILNKTCVQSLSKAGALDLFGYTRKNIFENYAKFRTSARAKIKKGVDVKEIEFAKSEEEWSKREILVNEMSVLGRTISGSMHEAFEGYFTNSNNITYLNQVPSLRKGEVVKVEAIVKTLKKEFTIKNGNNKGRKFGKYLIEDKKGNLSEITLWTYDYEKYKSRLIDGIPFKAICKVNEYMGQKDLSLKTLESVYGSRV
ncbi:DNA polymerase III subunit alpha [bacterium]|nr:DNA polymerase III subunit alpha [bacterium]